MRRLLALMALFAALLLAVGTIADITGTGAPIQVPAPGTTRWVQFIADPANTGPVRVGDSTVSATVGARVAPGAGLLLAPQGTSYKLSDLYVWAASGDKVSVLWGN